MNLTRLFQVLIPVLLYTGCTPSAHDPASASREPLEGPWRMVMDLEGDRLPFLFDLEKTGSGAWQMIVHNAKEAITVGEVELKGDSISMRMPLFDSEFKGRVVAKDEIQGEWHNYLRGPEYRVAFTALAGMGPRFLGSQQASIDVAGVWETYFTPEDDDAYPAIGQFEQEASGRVTGTFMTETGDYRYLDGVVSGDSLLMSCFDGSHAFFFAAKLHNGRLEGRFRSGTHWQSPWIATRNPAFELRHPDSLTHLREGYEMVDFSFPDLSGKHVTPHDPEFRNKVLLVQIMGSWCPNCVDETRLLTELYSNYHDQGLEVLSIAFEKHADPARAIRGLERFRDVLNVRYPILYAGSSSKGAATEKLPFLDHVMSFPTCIIVDHTGTVRRIRTGLYGPSTGVHYTMYKQSLEEFVEQLLEEARVGQMALR